MKHDLNCMQALGCAHIRQVAENQALSGLTRTMTKDLATSQENLSWAELAARYLEQSKSDLSARNTKLLVCPPNPNLLVYYRTCS